MEEAVIVSGVRTAIGNFGGTLKDIPAVKLGSIAIREAIQRAGLRPAVSQEWIQDSPDSLKQESPTVLDQKYVTWDNSLKPVTINDVIMGNVLQAGQGQNPARQASVFAGVEKEIPAYTVNRVCGSGLQAIASGAEAILAGDAEVVVAGGMESMSCTPYSLPKARWGYRMDVSGKGELTDLMVFDGLWEIFYGYHMGNTAENIVTKYNISRLEQDEVGLMSHERARAAIKEGIFKQEIVPVPVPQRKGEPVDFAIDERPMDTNPDKMAQLVPAFKKGGTCTVGNSSGINDGAAAVVLMSRRKADQLGIKSLLTIKSYAAAAVDPAYMGLGPIPAVRRAVRKAGLDIKDIDIFELNEAFAAQAIACHRELGLSWDNTNVHGSGISLGHPVGCTGARLTVTILHEMLRSNLRYGLVTMCIGGGQGMAMVVERKL